MGVALAVDFDGLVEIPRSGDGAVLELEDAFGFFVRIGDDFDGPVVLLGWFLTDADIAASSDTRGRNAVLGHDGQHRIGGLTFGDATEVEAHGRLEEGDGAGCGIEAEVLPRASAACGSKGCGVRESVAAAGFAPELGERAECGVEVAVGFPSEGVGFVDELEEKWRDGVRLIDGFV